MILITKKEFIKSVNDIKEFYFVGCIHPDEYSLEKLKAIIDNATYQQLTVDKRKVVKINEYQLISKNKKNEINYLNFKPFDKYFKDGNIYYISSENSTLIYFIEEE